MKTYNISELATGKYEGVHNLPLALKNSSRLYPSNPGYTSVDGTAYNYREMANSAHYLATMLSSAGVGPGQKVAILSENSPHWGLAYFGILITGATTVPILPDFRGSEIITILEHAEARAIFISGKPATA